MITGGYRYSPDDKIEQKIKLKDKHELATKGAFQKIYPCESLEETEYYDQFLSKSITLYRDRYGLSSTKQQDNASKR